jgi:hypothetical protein
MLPISLDQAFPNNLMHLSFTQVLLEEDSFSIAHVVLSNTARKERKVLYIGSCDRYEDEE